MPKGKLYKLSLPKCECQDGNQGENGIGSAVIREHWQRLLVDLIVL